MEIRVLQYFLVIAREESISRAAQVLHITQPTLSRQMKELEDYLGKQLFIRGNRKITLTEEGILLRQRAEEIVSLTEKAEMEIMASNISELSGDIYIGGGETIGMTFFTDIIYQIRNKYPNIKFHLYSGDANDVLDKLDKGLLDFGLVINKNISDKYNFITLPIKDTWGVLFHRDSELTSLDHITATDIKDKPLILPNQDVNMDVVIQNFQLDPKQINIAATYNLVYNASLMAKDHIGYVICLKDLINTKHTDLVFKPLYPEKSVPLTFVWKKYQVLNQASQYFLQRIQNEISNQ